MCWRDRLAAGAVSPRWRPGISAAGQTGLTLSKEQLAFAQDRMRRQSLDRPVENCACKITATAPASSIASFPSKCSRRGVLLSIFRCICGFNRQRGDARYPVTERPDTERAQYRAISSGAYRHKRTVSPSLLLNQPAVAQLTAQANIPWVSPAECRDQTFSRATENPAAGCVLFGSRQQVSCSPVAGFRAGSIDRRASEAAKVRWRGGYIIHDLRSLSPSDFAGTCAVAELRRPFGARPDGHRDRHFCCAND